MRIEGRKEWSNLSDHFLRDDLPIEEISRVLELHGLSNILGQQNQIIWHEDSRGRGHFDSWVKGKLRRISLRRGWSHALGIPKVACGFATASGKCDDKGLYISLQQEAWSLGRKINGRRVGLVGTPCGSRELGL